mmetsp:Transcript_24985/g.41796  ORF Transcript_24985/g.41796 Transcript_24985/m.41796 type:complete len:147 (-) Transcript_24985:290-730(-)|eukprot:CAMPEP_0198205280 /NCGR_PEP_ID=MMETSP1445-20131203/8807_1 /TAXON_ID=36898 /ORGANISM="Pyramimonas sp., Strain CCMP2087" /LENGTH=146 /DNA_ID=CAMNT_0043877533 /DNA_START=89 /DNA_END=529 /DNA_ORIENTATION=-
MALVNAFRAIAHTSNVSVRRAVGQASWQATRFYSASTGSRVIEVTDEAHYKKEVDGYAGLAVVDFTAKWCGPCKQVAPQFDLLSLKHTDVKFLKVDIDSEDLEEVVKRAKISAVPTFDFVKGGVSQHQIRGADMNSVQAKTAELSQ